MTKLIVPQWPMPGSVAACSSTRIGGVSLPPYDSLNLGAHCGDNLQDVEENRRRMFAAGGLPSYPVWLEQVHGTEVLTLDGGPYPSKRADASYSRTPGTVCAVMTADCLPVLFCNRDGTEVAAAHAGWRGLCEGVLEATVARFADKAENIMAWLGPAIGPQRLRWDRKSGMPLWRRTRMRTGLFVRQAKNILLISTNWRGSVWQTSALSRFSAAIAAR